MGMYINPGNSGFAEINNAEYVDKTLLIDLINDTIEKSNKLTCVSRPRRFGKSYAARMLTAFYDCSCDSHGLFDDKKIANTTGYEQHLNQYNVIYLDITGFISEAKRKNESLRTVPNMIVEAIHSEISLLNTDSAKTRNLNDSLVRFVESPQGRKFVFIIDEWDAMIREAKDDETAQEAYLNLLRGWFKNANFTPKTVAAAYMTGILPIKKDGSQSAISDFEEYTMIDPWEYSEYVGFTEEEVRRLCISHDTDYNLISRWYDGYVFPKIGAIYNPNSVMKAIRRGHFDSYWAQTSAAEGLLDYISKDYNGLTKTIAELIGGVDVKVNTTGFSNDLKTFRGKDDVLTLMIHLGYLAFNADTGTVRIPNEEVKLEFQRSIHEVQHEATIRRLEESERLFADTIHMNEDEVAKGIEKIHLEETTPLHYNREDSLRSVIKLAYYTYRDHYLQFEELPSGEGYADVVYIPRPDSDWPALVIELKWNHNVESAIDQILKNRYPSVLENMKCPVLLVGISYQKTAPAGEKNHTCKIIEWNRES